jgi:hypothetical protein
MKRGALLSVVAAVSLGFAALPSVAQTITYQGQLADAGQPANGQYDFQFRIFELDSGGSQIGLTVSANAVNVTDGLFSVPMDFGPNVFTADPRYLDIRVKPTGSPVGTPYTPLTPRTLMTAVPTAIRSLTDRWRLLSPGIITPTPGLSRVFLNTTTSPASDAVLSLRGETLAAGMYVDAGPGGGTSYYGFASGGFSRAIAAMNAASGLFTLAVGPTPNVFVSESGLISLGGAPSGTERLQVNGAVRASGGVTAFEYNYPTPQNRVLSIPPEAFKPAFTGNTGEMGTGTGVAYLFTSAVAGSLTSPVYLPENAVVTGFEVVLIDNTAVTNLLCRLVRREMAGTVYGTMAQVNSAGVSAAIQTLSDTTISLATIDNDLYTYMVDIFANDWDGANTGIKGVRIRYAVVKAD